MSENSKKWYICKVPQGRHPAVGTRFYLVHSIYAGCACICIFVGRRSLVRTTGLHIKSTNSTFRPYGTMVAWLVCIFYQHSVPTGRRLRVFDFSD
ncbi:MAG: hypothetical protein LBD59_03560 [Prevotellaceae bacterium]|nr:hypothetical protein [Prevotellaceae bacterium]